MTNPTQQASWLDAPAEVVVRAIGRMGSWGECIEGMGGPYLVEVFDDDSTSEREPLTDPRDAINFCNSQGCKWEQEWLGDPAPSIFVRGVSGRAWVDLKDATPEEVARGITIGTLQVLKPEGPSDE